MLTGKESIFQKVSSIPNDSPMPDWRIERIWWDNDLEGWTPRRSSATDWAYLGKEAAIRGAERFIHHMFGLSELREPGINPEQEITTYFLLVKTDGLVGYHGSYTTTPAKCEAVLESYNGANGYLTPRPKRIAFAPRGSSKKDRE